MAQVRSRTAVTGSPEFPLAHGRASDRAENGYPQRKTEGSILTKMFRKLHIFLYFSLPLWYNKGRLKLLLGGEFMAAADRKITYTAAEVAELIRPLTQSVEALQKENAELKQKLEHMNEILANAQRARFGQSSEKKTYVLSEDQMSLFNEAEICQDSKAEEPTEETLTVKAHARKKKRTIDELAKNLPVEEIMIDLPESRLTCDKCGGTFKLIGKKLVRRELIIIKQKLSKMNCVNDRELDEYIDRVIGTMSEDQLSELEQSPYPYVVKIQGKVKELIAQHRSGVFDTWLEQDKVSCLPNYALPAVISPTAFTSMVPKSLYTAEEDMNEYEFKVVWARSELGNVKWWHRNISRLGFQINGPVHAYPDIIVMLHSGKILMVETKGDHLDNDESKEKAKIGDQWAKLAGKQYKYYMVFETKQPDYPGAYSLERFMEIVKGL